MHLFSTREALRDNTNYIYTTVLNLFRYVLGIPGASDTLMHLGLLLTALWDCLLPSGLPTLIFNSADHRSSIGIRVQWN